jgi:hypothetical protein
LHRSVLPLPMKKLMFMFTSCVILQIWNLLSRTWCQTCSHPVNSRRLLGKQQRTQQSCFLCRTCLHEQSKIWTGIELASTQ